MTRRDRRRGARRGASADRDGRPGDGVRPIDRGKAPAPLGPRVRGTVVTMARVGTLAAVVVLLTACATSTVASRPGGRTKVVSYPPVPTGGIDCGISDELSGWPTTTVPGPATYTCLYAALDAGRPARFVVIEPSGVDSGDRTGDGYEVPATIAVTYRVAGSGRLEVTVDRSAARGPVTTAVCTGLTPVASGTSPTPVGCTSG